MARGFVIQNNFFESDTGASDRGILDNLGGSGITNDILLFDGNLRATSTIKAVESPTIVVTDFVFTAPNTIQSNTANFLVLNDGDTIVISETVDNLNDGTFTVSGSPQQTTLTVAGTAGGDAQDIVTSSGEGTIVGPEAANYDVVDGEIIIIGEGIVPYAEGTLVSYANEGEQGEVDYRYRATDSDTLTRFSLFDTVTQTPFVPTAPFKNINRSDSITQSDLFNLNTPRPDTGVAFLEGNSQDDEEGAPGADGENEATGSTSLFDEFSLGEQIAYIQERISLFAYKRGRVPITNQDTLLNANVTFEGSISLANFSGTDLEISNPSPPPANIVNPAAPGLFIRGIDGTAIKAFTDLSNPWGADNPSPTPGPNVATDRLFTLEDADGVDIVDVQVNKLSFKPTTGNQPEFIFNSGNGVASVSTININDYTHKLPATINGELYYLLLQST